MSKPWWNKNWGSDKLCCITHTRLRPGKSKSGVYYTTRLTCNHSFCTNSLIEWLRLCPQEPTCPICRTKFNIIDLIK